MRVARLFAIAFVFIASTLAWFALGTSLAIRTGEHDGRIAKEVELLWGGPHVQKAPVACIERPATATETIEDKDEEGKVLRTREVTRGTVARVSAPLETTRIEVKLALDHRRRGLLWYDTYGVTFSGRYRFRNPDLEERPIEVSFAFPDGTSLYDDLVLRWNGDLLDAAADLSKGVRARKLLGPGAEGILEISYRSRGVGTWAYAFAAEGVAQVRDFSLVLWTDFARIDFPVGTVSPSKKERAGDGWRVAWEFTNLVTGQQLGMDLPNRLNPGPLASRITFFAPVSLLFFLTVMVMLGVTSGENLHPMNYFFLAAAFFAFHLLLAYLVDHLSIHVSFLISAVTSVALVVSYLRVVTGMRKALLQAGAAQVVFLVLFSYAFFFEGYTGLTVTVGAVVTLFVLMQRTASVKWGEVFAARSAIRAGAR